MDFILLGCLFLSTSLSAMFLNLLRYYYLKRKQYLRKNKFIATKKDKDFL